MTQEEVVALARRKREEVDEAICKKLIDRLASSATYGQVALIPAEQARAALDLIAGSTQWRQWAREAIADAKALHYGDQAI